MNCSCCKFFIRSSADLTGDNIPGVDNVLSTGIALATATAAPVIASVSDSLAKGQLSMILVVDRCSPHMSLAVSFVPKARQT